MGIVRKGLVAAVISVVFVFCASAQNDSASSKPAPAVKAAVAKSTDAKPSAAAASEKSSSAKSSSTANDTLVIKARLLEIPGKFPPNDLYNYVYVMKYKVLSVEKGKYDGPEILVGHYNPLIPRKQLKDKMAKFIKGDIEKFEVGAKHHLYLITPVAKVWKDAMEDEYIDSDLVKYIAVKAEMAK